MRALMKISILTFLVLLISLPGYPLATIIPSALSIESAGAPLGQTFLLGTTWYDYQHNGSIGRMISLSPGGSLHFCWMNGLQAEAIDRHIYYNNFGPTVGLLWPDVGYQVDLSTRAGYSTCSNFSDGHAVVAFHQMENEGDPKQTAVAYDFLEGLLPPFQITHIDNLPGWDPLIWPKVAVCSQDYIHVVSCENRDGGIWQRIAYSRSVDGGYSYTTYSLVDTIIGSASQDVAASPVSNKVGIAYTKPIFGVTDIWPPSVDLRFLWFNNDVALVESEDGVNWDFTHTRNITNLINPDTTRWPDSTYANGDTLRAYCDVSLLYDHNDNAHTVFTTRGLWWDASLCADPDSLYFVEITRDASMIWHWSEQHDTLTVVADGWYDVGDPDTELYAYRGSGAWRSTVDRPSLGLDPETGYLYCVYVRCTQGDTSGGEIPSHGWANGEIYCSVSTDGGLNWSEGTNLTNTPSPNCTPGNCFDEDYPSQTLVINDTLHIIYVEDKDAGGVVMTSPQEGTWTENPVKYLKVPADLVPSGPPYVPNFYFHVGPVGGTAIEEPCRTSGIVPEKYALHQNYPNPFNASTAIRYQIPQDGRVTLKVFNTLGQRVRTLVDVDQKAGEYGVLWDGRDAEGGEVASGLYFCRLRVGEFGETVKMVLIR